MASLEERVEALEAIVAGLLQAEPDFMAYVRIDTFRDTEVRAVRFTHLPTGVQVLADSRGEAVHKLRKALADRARREHDLQEQERRRERKAAGGVPGAA